MLFYPLYLRLTPIQVPDFLVALLSTEKSLSLILYPMPFNGSSIFLEAQEKL